MDKSESEILAEWDLVSSVCDAEQENNTSEKKISVDVESNISDNSKASSNGTVVSNVDAGSENKIDPGEQISVPCSEETTNNGILKTVSSSENINSTNVKIDQAVEPTIETTASTVMEAESKEEDTSEARVEDTVAADVEDVVETKTEEATKDNAEEVAEADTEETTEADAEEISEPDTEEITVIETIMYDVKKLEDVDSGKVIETNIEKMASFDDEVAIQKSNFETYSSDLRTSEGYQTKEKSAADSEVNLEPEIDLDTQSATDSGDPAVSSIGSSMEHVHIESCETSYVQDLPELIPMTTEQDNASIESSSSDIDIIDENIEESITRSFLHPLSLSISSSVDTSAILSSSSESDKGAKATDVKEAEVPAPDPVKTETYPKTSAVFVEKLETARPTRKRKRSTEEKSDIVPPVSRQSRPQATSNILGSILQFLRHMSFFEWSIVGGVVISLYLTIVFNQTNIFAVVERDNVVSQMKQMIDELKNDNKLLKDQMLSEMKNDKVFSSFEHQIKELRKENSRLNHMLYGVAKVLENQKDAHDKFQKKEAEYLEPFKKEINKLKEHINVLKFDNEELQKQLVKMRYSGYSQGEKDMKDNKAKEQKEESKTDEIPLDFDSLKKWNELVSLLSKELGILIENDPHVKEKSETKRNISWYWKTMFRDFKGTFEEFRTNMTAKFSSYKKMHENTISDIYKSVKKFFTVEQNNQQFVPPKEDNSQWKNIGDFVSDLKDKWTKIKSRIDTSDFRSFFKDFKMSREDETSQHTSEKTESPGYEGKPTNIHFEHDRKPTNVHFDSERKPPNADYRSARKHDMVKEDESEDTKWMFDRAASRAELRDAEKEGENVNWFLKKNERRSKDDSEKNRH